MGIKVRDKETGDEYDTYIPDAPLLLHNCYVYDELDDVGYGWSWNPIHWPFVCGSFAQSLYYGMVNAPIHHIYVTNLNVAGDNDVRQHQEALAKCIQEKVIAEKKQLVLFGCSRGAATTFTSVATCPAELYQHIKLVIVEAPFDTVENVLAQSSWTPNLQTTLLNELTIYRSDQLSPLEATATFPLDIPVAFITSLMDTRVPPQCTKNVIDRLKARGHSKIHHLELKKSPHSSMPIYDDDDKLVYLNFLNTLYNKYID